MSNGTRGGMIVGIVVFSLAVYYFLWVYQPAGPSSPAAANPSSNASDSKTAGPVNYLNERPVIPQSKVMHKNDPAPDFTYYSIDGKEIKLSSFAGKKPVVLDFWATWCGPCRMELPKLEEFYKTHSDQVEIIAISDEDRGAATAIAGAVQQAGLTFPVMHDPSHTIGKMFPTSGIPYLIFIDKNGTVVSDLLGYNPEIGKEITDIFSLPQ
jgi:thiol-disulfide isomerase/thioredoxin